MSTPLNISQIYFDDNPAHTHKHIEYNSIEQCACIIYGPINRSTGRGLAPKRCALELRNLCKHFGLNVSAGSIAVGAAEHTYRRHRRRPQARLGTLSSVINNALTHRICWPSGCPRHFDLNLCLLDLRCALKLCVCVCSQINHRIQLIPHLEFSNQLRMRTFIGLPHPPQPKRAMQIFGRGYYGSA